MTDPPGLDGAYDAQLSGRGKRAIGLISLAVVAVVAAGVVYLHPTLFPKATPPALPSTRLALLTRPLDRMSLDFLSPSVGWALDFSTAPAPDGGRFWIFRTVDGAKHWQRRFVGQGASGGSVHFFDSTHGVVAVGAIDLYNTVDGGANWRLVEMPNPGGVRQEVAFSDSSHGWMLALATHDPYGPLLLFATQDSGRTWQSMPKTPADSNRFTLRGPLEGWFGSSGPGRPHVYTSVDGGGTWQRHDLPEPPRRPPGTVVATSVRLLPGAGVIADLTVQDLGAPSGSTYEFTSFDLGLSWTNVPPRPHQVFAGGEAFEDAQHWWVIDGAVVYKSSDAGQTWAPISDPLSSENTWRYYAHVIDSKHAWAQVMIGDVSGLALSSDAGVHWTRANVPQPATIAFAP